MSLFKRHSTITGVDPAALLIPSRTSSSSTPSVTNETALRHSAVWACLRLRANLISTMPVDLFRLVGGAQVEVPKPKVLVSPGGDRMDITEWMYSSQFDLDRSGNAFGLITERDGLGFPARIDLLALGDVSVHCENGEVAYYRVGGQRTNPDLVWHERQNTVAGLHVGLSPVAYAAWSIGEYLSIQDFALEWFGNSTVPSGHLKNTETEINQDVASAMKQRFMATVQSGAPFVTGSDWEYHPLTAANATSDWIEGKQYSVSDIARFFDCPGDMIDAAVAGSNITYASITQRNLQFLIHHIGPSVVRRENALSKLTPKPRFVKLNTDALLRMDPLTRAQTIDTQIKGRTLTNSEARALDNRAPLTEAQIAEFDRLYGSANAMPAKPAATTTPVPTGATP